MRRSFRVPIYNCQVDVIVTKRVEEAADEYNYSGDCTGCEGLTLHYPTNPSLFCVILRKGCVDSNSVAHECFHLTSKIMRAVDVIYDPNNVEPFAYLHGYLVEQITQITIS